MDYKSSMSINNQGRIKLSGGPVSNVNGAPFLPSFRSAYPYPSRPGLTFKVGLRSGRFPNEMFYAAA